jgi:uncharacterized protein
MTDPLSIIDHFYGNEEELRQLLLKHSEQVRDKALQILDSCELELDREKIISGALLHDIGILRCHAPGILCNGEQPYITHGVTGAEMLRQYGRENGMDLEDFARICERHTGSGLTAADICEQGLPLPEQDFLPETPEEILICLADKFFSKSGDMEEKTFEAVRSSMEKFGSASLERFDHMCHLFQVDETLPFLQEN